MVNARKKGANFEKEAGAIIDAWIAKVAADIGSAKTVKMTRNLEQSRSGGYDLNGIEKIALECKAYDVRNGMAVAGTVEVESEVGQGLERGVPTASSLQPAAPISRTVASIGDRVYTIYTDHPDTNKWWDQAVRQAGNTHEPFLIVKINRRPIQFHIPAWVVLNQGQRYRVRAQVDANVAFSWLYPFIVETLRKQS